MVSFKQLRSGRNDNFDLTSNNFRDTLKNLNETSNRN